MEHENPDFAREQPPSTFSPHRGEVKSRGSLKMKLPPLEGHVQGEESSEMFDRVNRWDRDFIQSAQKALREVYGHATVEVRSFKSLNGQPGHDENDYELTVQIADPHGAKFRGSSSTIKIRVRRSDEEVLQGG